LLHADADARAEYFKSVIRTTRYLHLNGIVLTEELWRDALAVLSQREAEHVDSVISCAGAVFPFKLSLNGWAFIQHVSFTGASLEAGCQFDGCNFERGLQLDYVDFDDTPAVFRDCLIGGELSGSFAHMDMDRQHLAFVGCEIRANARMTGISGDLRFDECRIDGSLDLTDASLSHLSLDRLRLGRQLDTRGLETRSLRASAATFETATFIGPLAAASSDFSHVILASRAQIALLGERANFQNATWQRGGRLDVEDAQVDLESVVLGAPVAVIGRGNASLVSIRDADAGLLSVSMMDLSRCVFRGAHRLQEMSVDSTVTLPLAPGGVRARRRCVADEFAWRARHTTWRKADWTIPGTTIEPSQTRDHEVLLPDLSAAEVAGVYRALRKALESGADEPGASDFYYGEMEMRRVDGNVSWAERTVITLYWLVAGYGLRATRALGWLVVVLMAGAVAQLAVGLEFQDASFGDALLSALEGTIPGVPTSAHLTTWGRLVDVILTVIGPVLLGLSALALRNRVKR
jgi:uncharacterized protein YjbI with pentapeptide repeats